MLINGIAYSWTSVTLILFGVPVTGITKIEYKRAQKKENNYGAGALPISRGYGNYEFTGSIEIYQDELRRIIASAPGRDPLAIGIFDIPVVFQLPGGTYQKDTLKACEFMEEGLTASQGDTKLMVTLPLIIGDIKH